MILTRSRMERFSGWRAAAILLLVFLLTEIVLPLVGGDGAAFLFVTLHFILLPLYSLVMIALTLWRIIVEGGVWYKVLLLSLLVVPIFILFLAASGEPVIQTWLDLRF